MNLRQQNQTLSSESNDVSHNNWSTKINTAPQIHLPKIWVKKSKPKPSKVIDTYWYFASERQKIYEKRVKNIAAPWTSDDILQTYKFTNAFRVADRTSQYLVKNVIYDANWSLNDVVFRVLLFKFFNKISTWELLRTNLGNIEFQDFDWDKCNNVLNSAISKNLAIYSAAYIMPSGTKHFRYPKKHTMHLELLRQMMSDQFPLRLKDCDSMESAYKLILAYPTIGPFLAYQFITDINYSEYFDYSESEFVVPGPGAKDGLRKCFTTFGDYSENDIIREICESQETAFKERRLRPCNLFGRTLQYIDCQNLFCEVDKYARVAHPDVVGISKRTRIKQKYNYENQIPNPWFPPKWKIILNDHNLNVDLNSFISY